MRTSSKTCRRKLILCLVVLAFSGCAGEHPIIRLHRRCVAEIKKMTSVVDLINDGASADVHLPAVRESYRAIAKIKREYPALIRKHFSDRVRKSVRVDVETALQRAEATLERALTRVVSREDLSEPFRSMLRLEAARLGLATMEAIDEIRIIQGRPKIPGNSSRISVFRRLIELYEKHGPGKVVEMKLMNVHVDTRERLIEATDGQAICIISESKPTFALLAPVEDFGLFCTRVAEFGKVSGRVDNGRELELTLPGATAAANNLATPEVMLEQAKIRAEAEKRSEDFVERMEATMRNGMVRNDSGPVDPNDYAKLAAMLTAQSPFDRRSAGKRLLTVDPKSVDDFSLRKQIARGYRSMAFERSIDNGVAIQGLVHWGGKQSVPILVQLMDREKLSIDDHLFEALARLKDPRGAEAVARQLGSFLHHDKAVASLRRMGPAAEDALINAAPSRNVKTSLSAVEILGDVGTEKSFSLLRKAMKSTNRDVRDVARASLKKIRRREKAAQ